MVIKENIKKVLKEELLRQTLIEEIMNSGIRDTSNLMSIDPKELLEMVGMKGTKEDMMFLTESIMENEVKEELKYCSYNIVPSHHSFTLYVFTPKPSPEHEGVWTLDQGVRYRAEEIVSVMIRKLSGGLIRGHNMYVYNTGDC